MAGGIDVKMGVSGIAQFKSAMNQAQQSVKTLDAQLKLNEKQYQATGDKETYMANKSKLLQQQISAQNKVVKEGQNALSAMEKQGVNPASQAYQKMQQNVVNAQAALLDMNTSLSTVGQSETETAQKTDQLASSLNGINKKVSFDAVLNGIGKITDGMEAAARKVEAIATDVWNTMVQAARWADDENTLAAMYGIDVETLQKMQGAARTIDTSVESIIKSQQKLKNNLVYGGNDFQKAIEALGVSLKAGGEWWKDNEGATGAAVRERMEAAMQIRDFEDIFWDIGEALLHYDDAIERDAMANTIFGKSWMDLMPLFKAGRTEYEKTLEDQSIVTEENVNKLNQLDDALQRLDQDYQATKNTILSELAPAFTEVGNTVSGLIRQFNEYLQTEEGQEKLGELSEAVTNLFSGLSDTDFSTALDSAKTILDSITGALDWINRNHTTVETAIKGIGAAFLGLKAAEVVGTLAQGAAALKNLLGNGGKAAAAGEAAAGGAAASKPAVLNTAKALAAQALPFVLEDTAVIAVAAAPAVITQNQDYAKAEEQRAERMDIAERNLEQAENDAAFLLNAASALGLQRDSNGEMIRGWLGSIRWGDPAAIEQILSGLQDRQNQQLAELYNTINQYGPTTSDGNYTWNQLQRYWAGEPMDLSAETALLESIADAYAAKLEAMEPPKVEIDPVVPDDAAAMIEDQIGSVSVDVIPNVKVGTRTYANGLPFVPFDGYIAALHKGERVVPANQNKSYTNTSNVYFDHVSVNNGTDADGLAARIAERTKQTLAGFGG